MSSNLLTGCSKITLPDLDKIAIESQLVVRKSRKFSPDAFLQSLLSSVGSGLASFNQMAANLKERVLEPMARQSLYERFSHKSTSFLLKVLDDLMTQRFKPVACALKGSQIRRVIIEDASIQALPKSNFKTFPSYGNNYGKTAAIKVDFTYDILSGTTISHTLQRATTQDKNIGQDLLTQISKGDLVLRDMGYFSLEQFTEIESLGAKWLSRLPLFITVMLEDGKPLEKRLQKSKQNVLELTVRLGRQGKKCRLIAVRASQETAEKRSRERKAKAKKNGKTPSSKGPIRDRWHLMVTNLEESEATSTQITEIYQTRWAIEIQFRAWKQSLNLSKALNRKSNKHHLQGLILAAMIAHQLGMKVAETIGTQVSRDELSFEKLYDILAQHLQKTKRFADLLEFLPDRRHVIRDKRKRKSPIESGLTALT